MIHDFGQKLAFSMAERQAFDIELLKNAIVGCVSVEKTDEETDKTGVDYVATLRRGAEVMIDAKARERGASKYWKHGEPELALELWSVCPSADNPDGKTGWTLSESTAVDMILYTFAPEDCNMFYLIPFQFLRMAFYHHCREWMRKYDVKFQSSGTWRSQAVFVPASVVLASVNGEMTGCVKSKVMSA